MLYWNSSWFIGEPVYAAEELVIISQWFNSFHIYAFTLVSGYLFAYLKYECGKYTKFSSFFISKFKRLIIPYIFVALIWVIPFAVYFFSYEIGELSKRFILGISPNQLWFLLMLFCLFIFFYPLSNFFRIHNVIGVIVVVLFYAIGLIGQNILPNVFQIFRACTYMPFFLLGFKIRQHGSEKLHKIPCLGWLFLDIIIFILVQYVSNFENLWFVLLKKGLNFSLHIVGAIMAFIILQRIAECINWKENEMFCILSKYSMPIYLFHQQVIYIFIYWLNGMLNPYLHTCMNFIGAMIISLIISLIMMKFKWTRFLIGEK